MRESAAGARGACLVLLGLAATTGCVSPAPTTAVYQAKAAQTAEDARSQVETARLASGQRLASRLPDVYLEPMLVACEEGLGALQSTFDSVQPPPTEAADAMRAGLDRFIQEHPK